MKKNKILSYIISSTLISNSAFAFGISGEIPNLFSLNLYAAKDYSTPNFFNTNPYNGFNSYQSSNSYRNTDWYSTYTSEMGGWSMSTEYVPAQNDNWSCGVYAATKVLKFYNYSASYSNLRENYSQKIYGAFQGKFGNSSIDVGLDPDRLAILINSYVAERIASQIKYGDFSGRGIKASVARGVTYQDIKREVYDNDRPVIALIKGDDSPLHWVTVIGWDTSNNKIIFDDSDGDRKIASEEEFQKRFSRNWNTGFEIHGATPNTIIKLERKTFNTLEAMFDTLMHGSENLIYKTPVLGEVYNLYKLGANVPNRILNYGVTGVNNALSNIGIKAKIPDLTIPLSPADIVKLKNTTIDTYQNIENEAHNLANNISAHPGYQHAEQTVNNAANQVASWMGW